MVDMNYGSGSSQGSGSGGSTQSTLSSSSSTTTPSKYLEPAANEMLNTISPVAGEFSRQLLEGLKTGGVGAQIPLISKMMEEGRRASSKALTATEEDLARTGQAGTPFGTTQLANQRREGAFKTSQLGPNFVAELIKMIPGFVTETQKSAIGGLGQAATTESSAGLESGGESWQNSISSSAQKQYGAGVLKGCCFIFLAADGYIHPAVRAYRDTHMTTRNVRGYYWLSDRLVPAMRKRPWLQSLIRLTLTRPLTLYARHVYERTLLGALAAPVAAAWRVIFRIVSPRAPYTRRGTKEVI